MRKLVFFFLLAASAQPLLAQNTDSVPEPEFINQVYVLKDHKLASLEKTQAEYKTKNKMGIGTPKQVYVLDGLKSSVPVTPGDVTFVVSTGSSGFGMDPSSQYELLKFDVKKNSREALGASYGRGKPDETSGISLNYKKLRDGVYGIVPAKPLEKGEYAFINKMSIQQGGMTVKMDAYAFSIQ